MQAILFNFIWAPETKDFIQLYTKGTTVCNVEMHINTYLKETVYFRLKYSIHCNLTPLYCTLYTCYLKRQASRFSDGFSFHSNGQYMCMIATLQIFPKCNFCKPITYILIQPKPVAAELCCRSHYSARYMGKEQGAEPIW